MWEKKANPMQRLNQRRFQELNRAFQSVTVLDCERVPIKLTTSHIVIYLSLILVPDICYEIQLSVRRLRYPVRMIYFERQCW